MILCMFSAGFPLVKIGGLLSEGRGLLGSRLGGFLSQDRGLLESSYGVS